MDLQPASSLLSPLSRVLIHTENQFHLTEPISLPVLIYGQDHDLGSLKKVEEDERKRRHEGWGVAPEASGKGRAQSWEHLRALFVLPVDWADLRVSDRHGKSPVGATFSAGAARHRGLCTATIMARKEAKEPTQWGLYGTLNH